LYWKNFTLPAGPDEAWVAIDLLTQICRWVNSGERDKIVYEMGLIEIAATVGHVGPDHLFAGMNPGEHLLKTADPAKEFGSQTDFTTELRDKMFVTKSKVGDYVANAVDLRLAHEAGESPINFVRVRLRTTIFGQTFQKEALYQD
jgi:hypothetical protein